jgi:hypothetical protein
MCIWRLLVYKMGALHSGYAWPWSLWNGWSLRFEVMTSSLPRKGIALNTLLSFTPTIFTRLLWSMVFCGLRHQSQALDVPLDVQVHVLLQAKR